MVRQIMEGGREGASSFVWAARWRGEGAGGVSGHALCIAQEFE